MPDEKESDIILKDEIRRVIAKLKNNKTPEGDYITAEMLKTSGGKDVDIMYRICNDIWNKNT